jgi:hypothetical protein
MSPRTKKKAIRKSFYEVWRTFIALIQSLYKLAPCFVIVMTLLIGAVTWVALFSSKLMLGTVLLVVFGVAVIVYVSTKNYGEAALALVAGLLTAYSVPWNGKRFISFIAIWSGFSFLALLISSVRLAGKRESIYRQASLAMTEVGMSTSLIEKDLERIGKTAMDVPLGPVERAEVIRVFAFRRLPLNVMGAGLRAVGMLSIITEVESLVVARFVADAYKIFNIGTKEEGEAVLEILHQTIRLSAVPPSDFMTAFEHSRRLVLTRSIDAVTYFAELRVALDGGVAPENMGEYLASRLPTK